MRVPEEEQHKVRGEEEEGRDRIKEDILGLKVHDVLHRPQGEIQDAHYHNLKVKDG